MEWNEKEYIFLAQVGPVKNFNDLDAAEVDKKNKVGQPPKVYIFPRSVMDCIYI